MPLGVSIFQPYIPLPPLTAPKRCFFDRFLLFFENRGLNITKRGITLYKKGSAVRNLEGPTPSEIYENGIKIRSQEVPQI